MRVLRMLIAAAILAGSLGFASSLPAQNFPTRPVTLVIPTQPGGPYDVVVRFMQPRLVERLGQPLIIDYRPGASLQIGTAFVAKAAPDGHTLLLAPDPHVINAVANKKLPYDTFRDFASITMLVRSALVLCVNPSVEAADLRDFVEYAKARHGGLNYASPALGSLSYLAAEEFKRRAGFDAVHIPYKGAAPAILGVVGNEAQFLFLAYGAVRSQIQAGKIRPIAVTAAKRTPELPGVAAIAESAVPGFEAYGWVGVFAPAATPARVISRLNADFVAALSDPEVHTKIIAAGFETVGSTPGVLDRFVKSEYVRWDKFVRENNVKFEQ